MHGQTKYILATLLLGLGTACLALAAGNAKAQGGAWSIPVNLSNTPSGSYCPRLVVDRQGTLHAIWQDWVDLSPHQPYILYAQKPRGGSWTSRSYLPEQVQGTCPAMALGGDGSLHVAISLPDGVGYMRRSPGGGWSELEILSPTGKNPDVTVAPNGTVHVAFEDGAGPGDPALIVHRSKAPGGAWSAPVQVSAAGGNGDSPFIAADANGIVHLLWSDHDTYLFEYAYLEPGGAWSDPQGAPGSPTPWNTVEQLASDARGKVHLVWAEWDTSTWPYKCQVIYVAKLGTDPWSDAAILSEECANHTAVTVDRWGLAHAVWNVGGELWYAAQGPRLEWGTPTRVEVDPSLTTQDSSLSLAADVHGERHLAWDFDSGPWDVWSSSINGWPVVTRTIPFPGGVLRSADGATTLAFPPGAVAEDTIVTHTPHASPDTGDLAPLRFFDLAAQRASDGAPVTSFAVPYTLTFDYLEEQKGGVIEDTLGLYRWDGDAWVLEPTSGVDPVQNRVTATLDHMTLFAVLGETNRVFLPLAMANYP
jgi:hypothetical protein